MNFHHWPRSTVIDENLFRKPRDIQQTKSIVNYLKQQRIIHQITAIHTETAISHQDVQVNVEKRWSDRSRKIEQTFLSCHVSVVSIWFFEFFDIDNTHILCVNCVRSTLSFCDLSALPVIAEHLFSSKFYLWHFVRFCIFNFSTSTSERIFLLITGPFIIQSTHTPTDTTHIHTHTHHVHGSEKFTVVRLFTVYYIFRILSHTRRAIKQTKKKERILF